MARAADSFRARLASLPLAHFGLATMERLARPVFLFAPFVFIGAAALLAACAPAVPQPTVVSQAATATPAPPTPTSSPAPTPTESRTATATLAPTDTPTATPTATFTASPTVAFVASATPTRRAPTRLPSTNTPLPQLVWHADIIPGGPGYSGPIGILVFNYYPTSLNFTFANQTISVHTYENYGPNIGLIQIAEPGTFEWSASVAGVGQAKGTLTLPVATRGVSFVFNH